MKFGQDWAKIADHARRTVLARFTKEQLYQKWNGNKNRKAIHRYVLLDVMDELGQPYYFQSICPTIAARKAMQLGCELLRLRSPFDQKVHVYRAVFGDRRRVEKINVEEADGDDAAGRTGHDACSADTARDDGSPDPPFAATESVADCHGAAARLDPVVRVAGRHDPAADPIPAKLQRKRLRDELRRLKAGRPDDPAERSALKRRKRDLRSRLAELYKP